MGRTLFILLSFAFLLLACGPSTEIAPGDRLAASPTSPIPSPESTSSPPAVKIPSTATRPTPGITPQGPTPPPPREWSSWPVIPYISTNAIQVYRHGIANGNKPHVFSVIGDCQSIPEVFLGIYATNRYSLPADSTSLEETIRYFEGSFDGQRLAVKDGMRVTSALDPLWADPQRCQPDESPVECDLRINRPSIVFINLGTNLAPEEIAGIYEPNLRLIIEILLAHGSLPILSTKADNIEGDYSINAITTRLAYEYESPLWNFWRAADSLPGHGLKEDGIYLTTDAWDLRNFSGLLVLDRVWKAVSQP
jgi:hypothetical protein